MTRRTPILLFGTVLIVTVLVTSLELSRPPKVQIMIDGQIHIGQPRGSFQSALASLGYKEDRRSAEMEEGETKYRLRGQHDEGTEPFLRVAYSGSGDVRKLSGRANKLIFRDSQLIFDRSSRSDIVSALGEPSWEKNVGGAIGMSYSQLDLYLEIVDGKLRGFSVGEEPQEPS